MIKEWSLIKKRLGTPGVNGKILEQLNELVYFGSMFSRDGKYEMDVERRIAAGNRVNGALAILMRLRNVSTAACLTVHNEVLVPTLLNGSETWVLQKNNERKMNAVEMRSLRRIYGVNLADRIRNEERHRMTGTSEDGGKNEKERAHLVWAR